MSDSCTFDFSITIGGATVTPDIFSAAVSQFGGGAYQPSGTYRISYVNGALKYNAAQGWALNAFDLNPVSGFHYVYSGADSQFPGTADPSYPSQAAVEAANAGQGVTFTHSGGTIGVYLSDETINYSDNVAGSPNPTFALTKLS